MQHAHYKTGRTIDRLDRKGAWMHTQRLEELRRVARGEEPSLAEVRRLVAEDLERLGRYRRVTSKSPEYPQAA